MLFIQDAKNAAWKNVLEPYLLSSAGPAPFIETDAQGYAIQAALTSAAGLTASPAQIPQLTAQSLDGATAAVTVRNPGNLADLRDQAYFQSRLPAGSADTDRHDTAGLVFALKTAGGGALVFYHLTARLSLTPPPGQTINLGIPGYYSSSQALTSAAVDYADQFAVYLPAGSACPRRHRRRLRYHRAGLTANQPDLASGPPCPRIWAQADPPRCAGGPGRIATCPARTRTVRR